MNAMRNGIDFDGNGVWIPGFSRRHFVAAMGAAVAALPWVASRAWASDAASQEDGAGDTQTVVAMDNSSVAVPCAVERYGDAWANHVPFDCLLDGGEGLVATATSAQDNPWLYAMVPALAQVPTVFGKEGAAKALPSPAPQVIFADDDDLDDELVSQQIPVVDVDFDTFDEMHRSLTLTAQVLGGDAPAKAQEFLQAFDQLLDEVAEATGDVDTGERPTVLYGSAVYEGCVEGTDSLANEWICAAGGQNANPDDDDSDDATVDDVQTWNPDIIVTGSLDDAQKILNDHAWDGIAAVRESRVYACPRALTSWGEAGPELMLQVLWLAGTMCPDRFPADEVANRVQEFYRTYYGFEASFEDVELMLAAQGPEAAAAASTAEKPSK